jgi:formate hydrogenlyase transcriptional activator
MTTMHSIALDDGSVTGAREWRAEAQRDRDAQCHPGPACEEIIGASAALTAVLRQVALVAPTDATVLIQGETGTGKELIARALQQRSARRHSPFIHVNGAAIHAGLLESALFGHERGAFTGAIAHHLGRFELVHQGTLLLDEVGELPLDVQPKLLRVLQEQTFERVGGTRTIGVDVRLVAATHRELAPMVVEGTFRRDLYYRLHVFPLRLPPVRERPEDIPLLVRHSAQQYAQRLHKPVQTMPAEALEALTRYSWPGNVRELQHVIERAVILARNGVLRPVLPPWPQPLPRSPVGGSTLADVQRDYIVWVLRDTSGVIGGPHGAAARLGVKRTTLLSRMERLGIARQVS